MHTEKNIDTYLEIEEFENHFAQVPKYALSDKRLTLKAKGLYAYLSAQPKNWKLYRTQMLEHLADGKDSLNSAFKELEEFGYLTSTPVRSSGRFKGYKLKVMVKPLNTEELTPLRKNRDGKTVSDKTVSGKSATTNTNSNNKDYNNKSLSNDKDNPELDLNCDDSFSIFIKTINTTYGRQFRKTELVKKEFSKRLKEGYSYQDMLKAYKNASTSKYHKDTNFSELTPEFITRPDKLEKYLNQKEIAVASGPTYKL
jgi:hypothetical protein